MIKKLKKTEDSIDQRISSVSTSIDNIENEENKLNYYKNKKGQNSSYTTYQQSLPFSQKPSPIMQNPSHSENGRKILTTKKNIFKTNEKYSSAAESQVKEDKNSKIIYIGKSEINVQNSKQQKNQTFKKSPYKNYLNDSFEFIKKQRQKPEEKKRKSQKRR